MIATGPNLNIFSSVPAAPAALVPERLMTADMAISLLHDGSENALRGVVVCRASLDPPEL
jgi:hypothetical protein